MDDLRETYRARLGVRVEALEAAYRALAAAPGEAIPSMRRLAHALKGSGATFGFPEITDAARAVEDAPAELVAGASLLLLQVVRQVIEEGSLARTVILVIESDDGDAQRLQQALSRPRRDVLVAAGAAEAAAVLARREVALIVLDLVLPDDDGRRLITRLRRDARTASVPILATSAPMGDHVQAECFALGADAYFPKPLNPDVVGAAVASHLERRSRATPPVPPVVPLPAPAPAAAATTRRVLLAEDDELIAVVVQHRLSREDYQVTHCADGLEALNTAQAGTFDLGVFDVKMPALDGFGLLERLRALPSWRATPIILLTSLGAEKDLVRGFALGASDYVVKPFSPAELVARVRRLVP